VGLARVREMSLPCGTKKMLLKKEKMTHPEHLKKFFYGGSQGGVSDKENCSMGLRLG